MPTKELKKLLDYCLNVKECSKCEYAKEEDCMLTCSALIKECLKENYAEVVRCKDCKMSDYCYPIKEKGKEAEEGWYCKRNSKYVKPNDFCSYGERKEE